MQIFDFTDKKKGRLLGSASFGGANGLWYGDRLLRAESVQIGRYAFQQPYRSAWEDNKPIDPEEFGVEAICFCFGQEKDGSWAWHYMGTWDWMKKNTEFKFQEVKK